MSANRHISATLSFASPRSTSMASEYLVRAAMSPKLPSNLKQLVSLLVNGTVMHEPGRFIIITKPFGISCVGYKQKNGGVFPESRFDRKGTSEEDHEEGVENAQSQNLLSIEAALPFLAERFREPNLSFCTGLKRYVSGAVVLPASRSDFQNILNSIRLCGIPEYGHHHRALAICVGKPAKECGEMSGYATFERVRDHSEYTFVAGAKAKLRARTGKYAMAGAMEYRLLDSKYGCSLIDISFSKFGRHLPRLMLTELLCPVLGDSMYMQRIIDVSGVPMLISPSHLYRAKRHPVDMSLLLSRLNISRADVHNKFPLFLHVYRSVFPRYGCSKKSTDRVDLLAAAPLPPHMLAMLECLGMSDAAARHLNAVAEEDSHEKRFSSESRF
ncbi:RNA pseudouridylate synthase domain-containing protein 3 [Toxocara canis]|uniref:RNA pseudouridylate synthase domain-containing protein 3 n=1 Tax=Toxocara canis TaxID=6265 RepID=A0A0B2VLW4_TOXCA|nr:RNA pseudouridylate synthase domain-containing protein 3 [Toxocara canis]